MTDTDAEDKPSEVPGVGGYPPGKDLRRTAAGAYEPPHAVAVDAEIFSDRSRGNALLAWIAIVIVTLFIYYRQSSAKQAVDQNDHPSRFTIQMLEVQGKYIVAASGSFGMSHERAYKQTEQMNQGPVDMRIRYVVLAGELAGPHEAITHLRELRRLMEQHGKEPDSNQQRIMAILETLYGDYEKSAWDGPSLSAADRDVLKDNLGWFGLLALGPRRADDEEAAAASEERKQALEKARPVLTVVLTGILLGFLTFGAGFIGAIILFIATVMGKLRSHLQAGSCFAGVYAETFAVWMILSIGFGFAAAQLPLKVDRLLLSAVVSLLTLSALGWPLLRGLSGRQLFREIGMADQQRRAWIEPFWGLVGYVCSLPLLAGGLIVTIILMSVFAHSVAGGGEFSTPNAPSHPITEAIGDGGAMVWLKMLFVASVVAPIVEEIMFRGILYRHLRDATAKWRIAISVLVSGGISSFVFAIMHPQGIFGVPVLMSLAFAFCLAREWRGSIVAPMTMHAINNGVVTVTLLVLLSL